MVEVLTPLAIATSGLTPVVGSWDLNSAEAYERVSTHVAAGADFWDSYMGPSGASDGLEVDCSEDFWALTAVQQLDAWFDYTDESRHTDMLSRCQAGEHVAVLSEVRELVTQHGWEEATDLYISDVEASDDERTMVDGGGSPNVK